MDTLTETSTITELERPTRTRHKVVGLAIALAAITYLDRVCISKLAPNIMKDLSLSENQMNFVFSAFTLAYALFEIPTARWADQRGTRKTLTRIVAWWSSFTMATAGAFNYVSLVVTRFLFGAGEAGAWPCVTSTFSRWIPARERGFIQGIFFAGAHLSGGLTPMLVVLMMNYFHWRATFLLFGLLGFAWAGFWFWWFRDEPEQHPAVNAAERRLILQDRWAASSYHASREYWLRLARHRNTWALCLMYVANVCATYFCITWLPTYLEKQHKLTAMQLGFSAGLPMMLSVLGDLFGGKVTDWASRRFGLRFGRCGVGAIAYVLASAAMFWAASTGRPYVCVIMIALALTASMSILGAAWAACIDIGGQHSGVVSATMNTAGNIGGMLVPFATTYLKDVFGTWNAPLYMMSVLFALGVVAWTLIDPRKRVFE